MKSDKFLIALGALNIGMFLMFSLVSYSLKNENTSLKKDVESLNSDLSDVVLDAELTRFDTQLRNEEVDTLLRKKGEQILVLEEAVDGKDKRWAKIKLVRKAVEDVSQQKNYKRHMSISELTIYASAVVEYSEEFDVPITSILAVSTRESAYNPRVVSHAGAKGLMQLMPKTADECARELGVKGYNLFIEGHNNPLFNIRLNVRLGTYYLSKQIRRFNDLGLAARAYNAGPDYVEKYYLADGTDRLSEPRDYAKAVLEWKQVYENFGL